MGCLIGGLIQRAGHRVTFIARGAQLRALQQDGLTLESPDGSWHEAVAATDDAAIAGKQDAIILCTKTYQLPQTAEMVTALMHGETLVVPAVNGLPWWYFQNHGGPFDGRQLNMLDPGGVLAAHIAPERIIGCVNYLAGTLVRPGHVTYVPELKRRIVLGELDGKITPRLNALGAVFNDAGFEPVLTETIRQSVWHKLWGNIAFNPIGALTHGTIDQLAEGYHDTDLLSAVMNETRFVADKLGVNLGQTIKSRIEAAARMRGHKTSMQQDIEAGRPTEIEAIVGAVREIGKWMQVDTPFLNVLYSLVKLKEQFYRDGAGQA
jgi:2-dehydropantoate 2-reductase